MLKYRVIISPSSIEKRFVAILILSCLIPVWLVKSEGMTILWYFQWLLSLCLIVFACQRWRKRSVENTVLIEEEGLWSSLNEDKPRSWKISDGSRVSRFILWVELSPLIPIAGKKSTWLWIFPDSVSKKDFRRLSRIIVRKQHSKEDEVLSVR